MLHYLYMFSVFIFIWTTLSILATFFIAMIFRPQPSLKLEWDSIYSILDQDLLSNIYAPAFTLVID